jgi:hypothetical protein
MVLFIEQTANDSNMFVNSFAKSRIRFEIHAQLNSLLT